MSACGMRANDNCAPATFDECGTLAKMVDHYMSVRGDRHARDLAWWGDQALTLDRAIHRAMFQLEGEGKRDRHQRPFSSAQLSAMGARLVSYAPALKQARGSFERLHKAVEQGLGLAPGRSPLLVYDVSYRLGCYLEAPPRQVYLHAGPKVGAVRLKPALRRYRRLDPADPAQLPKSLRTRLTPDQIENFLCVARRALRADLWD